MTSEKSLNSVRPSKTSKARVSSGKTATSKPKREKKVKSAAASKKVAAKLALAGKAQTSKMQKDSKAQTKSERLFDIIKNAKKIAIFTHINPDPDAYGSAFALRDACRNMGKLADVFAVKCADSYLDKIFPLTELRTDFRADEFDLVAMVDIGEFSRVHQSFQDEISRAKKIIIFDHHVQTEPVGEFQLVDAGQAACAQVLTHFFLDNKIEITPKIATYLWTGLIGDTGRFLYGNLSHDVLDVALKLFDHGADTQFVYDQMYRTNSLKDIVLQQKFLDNTYFNQDKTAGVTIFTAKDMKKWGVDHDLIKKYTNLIINIDGIKASFVAIEQSPNFFSISIRTSGRNAQKFAVMHGGGGHVCASGFNFEGSKRKLRRVAQTWCDELLQIYV